MKKCPKCGADNKDIQRFCSYCGSSLASPAEGKIYNIVMRRPAGLQWVLNVIHIKVDGREKYQLANDSAVTVRMTPGQHEIEMSLFGQPRKKKFTFFASEDTALICTPTVTSTISYLASPVKVVDSYGRTY